MNRAELVAMRLKALEARLQLLQQWDAALLAQKDMNIIVFDLSNKLDENANTVALLELAIAKEEKSHA